MAHPRSFWKLNDLFPVWDGSLERIPDLLRKLRTLAGSCAVRPHEMKPFIMSWICSAETKVEDFAARDVVSRLKVPENVDFSWLEEALVSRREGTGST